MHRYGICLQVRLTMLVPRSWLALKETTWNCRVLSLQKHLCSWRRVRIRTVGTVLPLLTSSIALGNHPFYSWSSVSVNVLFSPLAASLPLDSSFLLCLSAGMGVNSPGANFLVSLLGGFSFSQFSVFQGFQAVFLDAKAEVLGSVDKSVLDGRPM